MRFDKYLLFSLKHCFILLAIPAFFSTQNANGQLNAERKIDVEVTNISNDALDYAWSGGLNAPQFSTIDLNFDGILDLFVFDREGDRVLTFINNGTPGTVDYTYAPAYEKNFPRLNYWALLADYNGDGKPDIFTSFNEGVRVYKNTSSASSGISFQALPYLNVLTFEDPATQVKMAISSQDIPAIADIDSDGDIDILTFSNSATSVVYHENFAADSGDLESLRFHVNTYCWGNFEESATSNKVTLNVGCPKSIGLSKHAGGTMLAFDVNGDQDMELLLGDIFYPNMIFLTNGGNKLSANMISQDTAYPSNSKGIDIEIFPAAFYLDVDNDNLKDLIVCPNFQNNMENVAAVHYYKNTGSSSSASFTYQHNHFLQGEMIESGTGAYPVLLDYNFDGLQDIVIGNYGVFNGLNTPIAKLFLYQNNGTEENPKFMLVDDDFSGLSQLKLNTALNITSLNLIPTFADLNDDTYPDMIIGDYEGKLHYFVNHPKNGKSDFVLEEADFQNIDVGRYAAPQLYDIDRDGLFDLVIGEQEGNLNYYKNTGIKGNPAYTFVSDEFGGVSTSIITNYPGYSQPYFFRSGLETFLICGSESGRLFCYKDITTNLTGNFTILDSSLYDIDAGRRSHIALGDINKNGMIDLIIGNYAGGLSLYQTDQPVGIAKVSGQTLNNPFDFSIRNLNETMVRIEVNADYQNSESQLYIVNTIGQTLYDLTFNHFCDINISNFNSGMYFFTVRNKDQHKTHKQIILK